MLMRLVADGQPPARGECLKEFVIGVGGISHNLPCTVLERWKISANHLLCRPNDTLPSALVLGGGSSVQLGMEEVRMDSVMEE